MRRLIWGQKWKWGTRECWFWLNRQWTEQPSQNSFVLVELQPDCAGNVIASFSDSEHHRLNREAEDRLVSIINPMSAQLIKTKFLHKLSTHRALIIRYSVSSYITTTNSTQENYFLYMMIDLCRKITTNKFFIGLQPAGVQTIQQKHTRSRWSERINCISTLKCGNFSHLSQSLWFKS